MIVLKEKLLFSSLVIIMSYIILGKTKLSYLDADSWVKHSSRILIAIPQICHIL